MNLSEKSPREIEHSRPEATPQALNHLQPVGSAPNASATAARNGSQTRSGLRVMRASPVILVACGIVFASLIFLLDSRAQTDARAGQETGVNRTASNSPAKSQSVPASVRQETAQTNVPTATPSPSATPAPTQEASPVPASQTNDEELARQQSAIASGQPASDVKASGVEASADEGNYTLQVGSFNNLAEASERVAKLGSLGITAYVARVEIPKRGTWYRVQTGSFSSREEAARYGAQLRSRGSVADFIITERRAS